MKVHHQLSHQFCQMPVLSRGWFCRNHKKNFIVRNHHSQPPFTTYFPQKKGQKIRQTPFAGDKMHKIRWYIENKKKIMIIMRGCPGSGKTFLAKGIIQHYGGDPKDYVFSTDDFFIKNNRYCFQQEDLREAHQWNQRRVLNKVRNGWSPIIIDNTNTEQWEMIVYATFAVNNGYALEVLEPDTPWFNKLGELVKRNQHGVPREKIKQMLERYETGIDADKLIKSTEATYSKPLPQNAQHSLLPDSLPSATSEIKKHPNLSQGNCYPNSTSADQLASNEPLHMIGVREELPSAATSSSMCHSFSLGSKPLSQKGDIFNPFKSNPVSQNIKNDIPDISDASDSQNVDSSQQNSEISTFSPEVPLRLSSAKVETSEEMNRDQWGSSQIRQNLISSSSDCAYKTKSCGEVDLITIPKKEDFQSGAGVNVVDSEHCVKGHKSQSVPPEISVVASNYISNNSVDLNSFVLVNNNKCENPQNSTPEVSEDESSTLLGRKPEETSTEQNACNEISSWEENKTVDKIKGVGDKLTPDPGWDKIDKCEVEEASNENSLPKPPRVFSMKSIQNYCQSVKDMDAGSQNVGSSWLFGGNCPVSWQSFDEMRDEVFNKENSASPFIATLKPQRHKFIPSEVVEKATNTNHEDFSVLYALNIGSCKTAVEGVNVLVAYDRDINNGSDADITKVSLKTMLDKGTTTDNEFGVADLKTESKQDKIKQRQEKIGELVRLFPHRAPASIKELLKRGKWDVNYVSNLLLDAVDNDTFVSMPVDVSSDFDSDDSDYVDDTPICWRGRHGEVPPLEDKGKDEVIRNEKRVESSVQEEAKEVKRHIEQSIDFPAGSYSPHVLSIINFRRGQKEGAIPKIPSTQVSNVPEAPVSVSGPLSEPINKQSVKSESIEGIDEETLEFIVSRDFIQQLVDKFGEPGSPNSASLVVKFPISLARQIYDAIFLNTSSEEEDEDDDDLAVKLQCEEDERMARHLYEEMLQKAREPEGSSPNLHEIMDMELAQAIYRADVHALTPGSQETMATVLAKRLLEDNYNHIDKRTLHDIFASCNYSFEDTVKTLQEADAEARGASGAHQNERIVNKQDAEISYQSVKDDLGSENPWEMKDPKEYYDKYRQKADDYLKERNEMYRKANEAFRRNQRSVAAYYSKLGELNGSKYHHANAMAAAALAAAHIDSHSIDTLDLHQFKVIEAITVFDLFIDYHIRILSEQGLQHQCLEIITGRGTHSVNGKPRVKPAIMNRAKKRNLRCQELRGNPGVVQVWVSLDSRLSHTL